MRSKISPKRLHDNVILRRQPKNLEIHRVTQDDNSSLRRACPELAEGLRMTNAGIQRVVGQTQQGDFGDGFNKPISYYKGRSKQHDRINQEK